MWKIPGSHSRNPKIQKSLHVSLQHSIYIGKCLQKLPEDEAITVGRCVPGRLFNKYDSRRASVSHIAGQRRIHSEHGKHNMTIFLKPYKPWKESESSKAHSHTSISPSDFTWTIRGFWLYLPATALLPLNTIILGFFLKSSYTVMAFWIIRRHAPPYSYPGSSAPN